MNRGSVKLSVNINTKAFINDGLKKIIKRCISEPTYALEISNTVIQRKPIEQEIQVVGMGIYDNQTPKEFNNRYYLELNLKSSNPKQESFGELITLMMNPSWTFPKNNDKSSIDATVKNVIKIANKLKKSKVIILNTLPIIHSNKQIAVTNVKEEERDNNKNFIIEYLNNIDNIIDMKNAIFLAAWGSDKHINEYNEYSKIINNKFKDKKIKAIAKNHDGTPMHPGPMPKNREAMAEFFKGNSSLIDVMIDEESSSKVIKI